MRHDHAKALAYCRAGLRLDYLSTEDRHAVCNHLRAAGLIHPYRWAVTA